MQGAAVVKAQGTSQAVPVYHRPGSKNVNLFTAAAKGLGRIGKQIGAKAKQAVRAEFDGQVARAGEHVTQVASDSAQTIIDNIGESGRKAITRLAADPAVNKAVEALGQKASAPVQKRMTPTIIGAAAAVIIFAAILVYSVRKR